MPFAGLQFEKGCITNLYVVVVDDGLEIVAALANDEGAARSWTATALAT